ncbi:MAG: phenylalanine--tRNA ligase subunit beta [Candidatus Gribaldobacteria bacterium]|nr:phenylalanine--tRNA ligase subunit beta [Candidatus Gribaldobacteria bacterium]
MKFSYNWICEYLQGEVPSAKEVAELLMFHSFEVESVEKSGADFVLDIKVLPNRICDCSSHIGIAREVASIAGLKLKILASAKSFGFEIPRSARNDSGMLLKIKSKNLAVKIENPKDCLRYTGQIIKNIKVGESPQWLKDRLISLGLKPINNIVDATNYIMLETGQPLHAFDLDKINGGIIVRRAKKGEKIATLDKEKSAFDLDENILVIADAQKPIAIAGIKGGVETGIDENTKNIIIEAANFYGPLVRKASQKLKLKTDASLRFENWLGPDLIDGAQNRAKGLVLDLAGGEANLKIIDAYPKKALPKKIKLDLEYVAKVLGETVKTAQVIKILNSLDFKTKTVGNKLEVEVPSRRMDVNLKEDLIEEIGRMIGYEKIEAKMPIGALNIPATDKVLILEEKIKDYFTAASFNEVINYSFVSKEDLATFRVKDPDLVIELENPLSQLTQYLRPALSVNLLKTANENLKYTKKVRLFEVGKIYQQNSGSEILETKFLGGVIAGNLANEKDFFVLKGVLEEIISRVSSEKITWAKFSKPGQKIYNENKTAILKIGKEKETVGVLGEIHPSILEALNFNENYCVFDIDLDKLLKFVTLSRTYLSIAQSQPVERDLSLWVPENIETETILDGIEEEANKIKKEDEKITVFLVGVDKEIAKSVQKINVVVRINYQATNRGLFWEEIKPRWDKIITALESREGWEVRK